MDRRRRQRLTLDLNRLRSGKHPLECGSHEEAIQVKTSQWNTEGI